ncbi:MAG: 3-isopropylmalate dehydrogenase [Firmicutes bacterium]|nr:3-isopropylmalate dehydrogenase [Bacillota bacterium]
MRKKIAVLPGDGIGPEIISQAIRVLDRIAERYNMHLEYYQALVGGAAYDATGHPLPAETLELCRQSDAVLFGAVGGPKWDNLPPALRPEAGALLPLRKELGLFANLRPALLFSPLAGASPLKPEVLGEGLDILVVRELTGGIYFGQPKERRDRGRTAVDTCIYTEAEVERIAHVAFRAAQGRCKKVASVDKANVLETSRLWREVVTRVAGQYPDVELQHVLVDNAAMQLIRNPRQFDVILTENMFGDILSDEAAMLTGSLGMLPSASLGEGTFGLYEPVHGSAPDIAGQGIANPLATILSTAMMLRYSFGMEAAATDIEKAVDAALREGYRTPDIWQEGCRKVGTMEMTDAVLQHL